MTVLLGLVRRSGPAFLAGLEHRTNVPTRCSGANTAEAASKRRLVLRVGKYKTTFLADVTNFPLLVQLPPSAQVTEFDPKNSRDKYYTLSIDQEKRRGPYRTMAQVAPLLESHLTDERFSIVCVHYDDLMQPFQLCLGRNFCEYMVVY